MFKRYEIAEAIEGGFKVRILKRGSFGGLGGWWEVKELPADDERKAAIRYCSGYLMHESSLRKISNR